jgi:hypothetical protein
VPSAVGGLGSEVKRLKAQSKISHRLTQTHTDIKKSSRLKDAKIEVEKVRRINGGALRIEVGGRMAWSM